MSENIKTTSVSNEGHQVPSVNGETSTTSTVTLETTKQSKGV